MMTMHSLNLFLLDSGAQTWLVITVCAAVFLTAYIALRIIDKKSREINEIEEEK